MPAWARAWRSVAGCWRPTAWRRRATGRSSSAHVTRAFSTRHVTSVAPGGGFGNTSRKLADSPGWMTKLVGRTARVLSGVSRTATHLAAPKVANAAVAPGKDIESRYVCVVSADVVASEVALKVGVKPEVVPATLLLDRQQAVDG